MTEQNVQCPKCGHEFALSTALAAEIESGIRSQFVARETELRAEGET
jgi:hypothetical protein